MAKSKKDTAIPDTDLQVVIFDMDGVIVESESIYDELFKRWLREHTDEVHEEIYTEMMGKTWLKVFEYAKEQEQLDIDPVEESEKMADEIVQYIEQTGITMREGAQEAINKLGERYTLALVSSSPRKVVERMLQHHRLLDRFKHITTVEDVQHPKPHPQPYAMTMAVLGVAPEACIVIEDSLAGVQSGCAAGAFVYALPDPRIPAEKYDRYAKVVYHFADVMHDLL